MVGNFAERVTEAWQLLHISRNSLVIAWRRVLSKSLSCLLQQVQRILGSSFLFPRL